MKSCSYKKKKKKINWFGQLLDDLKTISCSVWFLLMPAWRQSVESRRIFHPKKLTATHPEEHSHSMNILAHLQSLMAPGWSDGLRGNACLPQDLKLCNCGSGQWSQIPYLLPLPGKGCIKNSWVWGVSTLKLPPTWKFRQVLLSTLRTHYLEPVLTYLKKWHLGVLALFSSKETYAILNTLKVTKNGLQ